MVSIYRNKQAFGPYSLDILKRYIEEGKILLTDVAKEENLQLSTVRDILKRHSIKPKIKSNGNIVSQIQAIGSTLLFPTLAFIKSDLFQDKRLISLALVGLAPAFMIRFSFVPYLTFYAIALYFSVLWAIFFNTLFKTSQVNNRSTIILFFLSQLSALIFVNLQSVPPFNILYSFTESDAILSRLIGFIFGVGFLEESIKALPLFYLLAKTKEPIIPQTLVFYGLMSGIGFGVFEGVEYQTNANTTLEYNQAFFMNIARLTSLPFLHAVWCGIAAYFISFANLFPLNRKGLYLLAIAIPAILHGAYDVFGWSLVGLFITVFSVFLLVFYLKKSADYQSKLLAL